MNQGHFKLGLFVVTAIGLLVGLLLLLGVLQRFEPTTTVETYFAEPVNGLATGAEVRYRGLKIGTVGNISLVQTRYRTSAATRPAGSNLGRLILVDMKLSNATLAGYGADVDRPPEDTVNGNVNSGMRARLTSSGLGGPLYIELDFLEPELRSDLAINWKPQNPYIPSARSAIRSILDDLQILVTELERTQLVDKLAATIDHLGRSVDQVTRLLEDSKLVPAAQQALKDVSAAGTAVERLVNDQRISEILDSTRAAMADVRSAIREGKTDIPPLLDKLTLMSTSLTQAADNLDRLAQTVDRTELIPRIDALAKDLGPAGKDLSRLADRLDRLIGDNAAQLVDTIQALRTAAFELRALIEDVGANPSRVIFSGPPVKSIPGNKP
jgi:ABC-type transporter Mla subunit MlaD